MTLRPDGTIEAGANWSIGGGAGSHHAAQSDNADGTYSQQSAPGSYDFLNLDLATFAFPALSQIRTVTWRVRCSYPGYVAGDTVHLNVWLDDGVTISADPLWVTTTTTTVGGPAKALTPGGAAWTQAMIDRITLGYRAGGGSGSVTSFRVYESYLDVVYNEAPVATVTGPTGTVTTTSTPDVTWTFSDPEGDAPERWQAKIFTAAQYGIGGFDPETSPYTWWSGEVLSAAVTATPAAALPNATYRAYVKVGDAGSSGRYGAWAYSGFTVDIPAPAVPVLTAVADPANNRVAISVTGHDNYLTANQSSLETDTTGWTALSNSTVSRSTVAASHGQASLLVTAVAAGPADAVVATPPDISGFGVSAGMTVDLYYEARKVAGAARDTTSGLVFYDAGGGVVPGGFQGSTDPTVVTGSFQPGYSKWVVPAGAVTARATLTLEAATAGEAAYFDKIGVFPYDPVIDWTVGGFAAGSRFTVERSSDGGVTWEVVRSFNRVAHDGPATQLVASYDFEAPRGVPLLYRARVAGSSVLSSPISADTATVAVTLVADGQAWLKSYLDPTLNMAVCLVKDSVDSTSTEDQGVFEALGRPDPLIHGGTVRLEVFSGLEFWFRSDAEWDAFEAIRRLQVPVLLQTCFGDDGKDEWWLRLGPTRSVHRVTHDEMGVAQWRSVKLEAREVLRPAVT